MDKTPPIFTGTQNRAFRPAEIRKIDVESRTVELCFSSETEVERAFGFEVLSHAPGAVVLTRLQTGAPLLLNHEAEDQIGVVESVSIDSDRRGRAVVRFGKSKLADEIFQDVQDGIRRHVSVGYLIHEAKLTDERSDGDVYTVTKWEPFEISIVPVPADPTVGVGRSLEPKQTDSHQAIETNKGDKTMSETTQTIQAQAVDVVAERQKATAQERERVRSISEIGEKFGAPELARDAIREGVTVADFQARVLDHINLRGQRPLSEQMSAGDIGLTEKEARNFSFVKVIRALADPKNGRAQEEAAFEFEASRAAADSLGKNTGKFVVPADVLTRALNTNTNGSSAGNTGGHAIATNLLSSSFIDLLRNRTTIMRLGTTMGGLVGNVDIPKQTAGVQGYWLGEDEDATEVSIELGDISMTPKTVAGYSEITRKMLIQSSLDMEALVRANLAIGLAQTIDIAGYYGTGTTHQPLGIANQTGINAVAFAGSDPTFKELIAMETAIAMGNAAVSPMAYVANAAFMGYAKGAVKFPSAGSATIWEDGNTVNGSRVEITNQITTGDVFMGNFNDLLIGMWSGLELNVDTSTWSKKGRLRLVAFQDLDLACRRPQSFCLGRHV
jgi:HK97 family phage major capsid protein/HK97 family phage prohead protease